MINCKVVRIVNSTVLLAMWLGLYQISISAWAAPAKFECWSAPDDLPPFNNITHPCFSQQSAVQCRCNNYIQDCSSNYGNLAFIPGISHGVRVLNFSNNYLLHINSSRFFDNITRSGDDVWLVDLYNNNMTSLSFEAFSNFSNLTTVLIGGNRLTYNDLKLAVFSIPTLRKLDIKCGGLEDMPSEYFNGTSSIYLKELDFSWNRIRSLDMTVLKPLKQLTSLTLWHNTLSSLTTAYMPSLRNASFHKNAISDFPQTCTKGTRKSLFPSLVVLDLNFNLIYTLKDPICLPRLHTLNLNYNRMQYFYSDTFSAARFPALVKLEINQMESKIWHVEDYFINNSLVHIVFFGLQTLDFSFASISGDMFAGCPNVHEMFLNSNNFKTVSVNKFQRLFQPLKRLQTLLLKNNGIEVLHGEAFKNMSALKELNLSNNTFLTLPDGVFNHLRSLQTLELANNLLTSISVHTFSLDTRTRLRLLDLSGNPFECSCDIVWFQHWLSTQPNIFRKLSLDKSSYNCANLPNTAVTQFFVTQQACLLSRLAAIDIIVAVSIILTFFFVIAAVYGYRWHLRLWLYEICRGRQRQRRRQMGRELNPFQYDVFLAYAEEDMEWVHQELLPVLEEEWRLKVCVHLRDFVPGKHIVDNISDCVGESDRILMVFSQYFARSQWCQFELKFCQTSAMDRDDILVLVMLEGSEPRNMTTAMLAVLRTTTYIEWNQEQSALVSFWGRLKLALGDVI